MFASGKGKQQKQIRQLQCQEQCIAHIPYYLSGLSLAHFFRQHFSKQLYTNMVKKLKELINLCSFCKFQLLAISKKESSSNIPRSIYQNSNMTPRLQGQNCQLSRNSQKRLEHKKHQTKYRKLARKRRSHVRILTYRRWALKNCKITGWQNVNELIRSL